jgi:hypothetical protein
MNTPMVTTLADLLLVGCTAYPVPGARGRGSARGSPPAVPLMPCCPTAA